MVDESNDRDVELPETPSGPFGRLLQGTSVVFVGSVFGMAAGFLTRVVAARYLGPSSYGLVVLGLTVRNLGTMGAVFGLRDGLAQRIPRVKNPGWIFTGGLTVGLTLGTVIAAVLVAGADPISQLLGDPRFEPVLVLFALSIPLMAVVRITIAGFRGLELAGRSVMLNNIFLQGLTLVAVVAGGIAGFTFVPYVSSWLAATAVTAGVGILLLHRRTDELSPRLSVSAVQSRETRDLVAFSLPLLISQALWRVMRQSDNVFIGYFASSAAIGTYDVAFTVSTLLLLFMNAPGFLFVPILSGLDAEDAGREMDRLYKTTTKWMAFASLPAFLFVVQYPEPVVGFLFGVDYVGAAPTLRILVTGFYLHILFGLNGYSLKATGNSRVILYGNFLALAANLALNVTLIPRYGIIGAAAALTLGYTVANFYWAASLYKGIGIQPFHRAYVAPVVGSTGMFVLFSMAVERIFPSPEFPHLLVLGIAFTALHLAVVVLLGGIKETDREAWRNLVH